MRTTETNLEPILLVHEGTSGLRELISDAAATAPAADFVALDGSEHRLWIVTDAVALEAIARELTETQVLIADGHHRYAAYLRLQQELRDPAAADGGLALGLRACPPRRPGRPPAAGGPDPPLGGSPDDVRPAGRLRGARGGVPGLPRPRGGVRRTGPSGRRHRPHVVRGLRRSRLGAAETPRTSPVDAAVLHEVLLPAWGVADEQIGYHHSLDQALHTTARQPGIVVAVHPPTMAEVMATAARGVRMPRKSTSFAPKPRMGVVMRDLRDA